MVFQASCCISPLLSLPCVCSGGAAPVDANDLIRDRRRDPGFYKRDRHCQPSHLSPEGFSMRLPWLEGHLSSCQQSATGFSPSCRRGWMKDGRPWRNGCPDYWYRMPRNCSASEKVSKLRMILLNPDSFIFAVRAVSSSRFGAVTARA